MLLVDDDHRQVPNRRKDGGPSTDYDSTPAGHERAPSVGALAIRQTTVQYRDRIAENSANPRYCLRCESDLRHQHDCPATAADFVAHRFEIYESFPTSGDTEQREGAAGLQIANGTDGLQLGTRGLDWRRSRHAIKGIAKLFPLFQSRESPIDQSPDNPTGEPQLRCHAPHGDLSAQGIHGLIGLPLSLGTSERFIAFDKRRQRPGKRDYRFRSGCRPKRRRHGLEPNGPDTFEPLQNIPHRTLQLAGEPGCRCFTTSASQFIHQQTTESTGSLRRVTQLSDQARRPPHRSGQHGLEGEARRSRIVTGHPPPQ